MTLKELLKKDFKVELPISGGFGNSIENAIIIHRTDLNDYVQTEYFILNCLGKGRGIEWKLIRQELKTYDNKKIDKIKIETKQVTAREIITQIENYYFDITDCYGVINQLDDSYDEECILEQIKDRILVLESISDINKECIMLLKKDELFDNHELTMKFLEVIFKDESYPLFERIYDNKRKSVISVLSIVGRRLNENR